ncbi:hypothetical protein E2C01_079583 [Portunus trituberculatus]|uniref:Uncharacterized protein n=1 Tax=Portunus trituberculatus TaxID=210409 RepID=A0A5B7IR04_PORTR|nr:hypothetical protein [Portunus trituberculatus]
MNMHRLCLGPAERAQCGWNSIYLVYLPGIASFGPFNHFKLTIAEWISVSW